MALYAIGDLHLCLGAPKPMDIFGGAWVGYMDKLRDGLSVIRPEDTTVLLGDLSWALDLSGAKADFAWINAIPGRKIILKGNHDYWWSTAAKFRKFCEENGFENLNLLNNNCYEYEGVAICGTRGWFYEEDRSGEHDEKVFKRELLRLDYRMEWEDALRQYLLGLDARKPVIYCGDLNVAHREIDLKNPKSNRRNAGFTDEERGRLSTLLDSGFTDTFRLLYPDTAGAYTWWSYMFHAREKNAGWRIDYFIVSNRIAPLVQDSLIYKDVLGSDHCPVGLLVHGLRTEAE